MLNCSEQAASFSGRPLEQYDNLCTSQQQLCMRYIKTTLQDISVDTNKINTTTCKFSGLSMDMMETLTETETTEGCRDETTERWR